MRTVLLLALPAFILFFGVSISHADDEFGGFSSNPILQTLSSEDGRPAFKLLEKFSYKSPSGEMWEVPANYQRLDGASIPKLFWSIVGGPLSGNYLNASIIHDYYCDVRLKTQKDTHRVFYYSMRAGGVPEVKAKLMYLAVAAFGPKWEYSEEAKLCLSGIAKCVSIPPPTEIYDSVDFEVDQNAKKAGIKLTFKALADNVDELSLDDLDDLAIVLEE